MTSNTILIAGFVMVFVLIISDVNALSITGTTFCATLPYCEQGNTYSTGDFPGWDVILTNSPDKNNSFVVTVSGDIGNWITNISPAQFNLSAGETKSIRLTILVPVNASIGMHTGTITATGTKIIGGETVGYQEAAQGTLYADVKAATATTTTTSTTTTTLDTTPPTINATIYPATGNYSVINVTVSDTTGVRNITLYTNGNYTDTKQCYGSLFCYWTTTVYRFVYGFYTYMIKSYDNSSNVATAYLYANYTALTTTTTTSTTTTTTIPQIDNLLINEFQSNPNGTDAGNEWVELYNNGSTDVNLTGWTLETLSLSGLINSHGFKQIIFPTLTLTNTGDVIVLKYGNTTIDRVVYGTVVNETSVVAAPDNGQSAGRSPDGSSSWTVFVIPTPGTTNYISTTTTSSTTTSTTTSTSTTTTIPIGMLYISPQYQTINKNSGVNITIQASNITDLYGYQFTLRFDPSILEVVRISSTEFLVMDNASRVVIVNKINNTAGNLEYAETRTGVQNGVNGSGILAVIEFNAISDGISVLGLENVLLSDSSANEIKVGIVNGSVNVGGVTTTSTTTTSTSSTTTTMPLLCPVKGDEDCDGVVGDFELLHYIEKWGKGIIGDSDVLEAIDNWVKG